MQLIAESTSPDGRRSAVVEATTDSVYLYVRELDGTIRACWLRNVGPAPGVLDASAARSGRAPMLPAHACGHPLGMPAPSAADVELVWLEDVVGVAVVERGAVWGAMLASDAWIGRARDCLIPTVLAAPLAPGPALDAAVRTARGYWRAWEAAPTPWQIVQAAGIRALEAHFGAGPRYFAIDDGRWPPKALVRFDLDDRIVLVTIGVCLRMQPGVSLDRGRRRIELGICLERGFDDTTVHHVASYLGGQTELPWASCSWLGEGHTIPCDAFGSGSGSDAGAVILTSHELDCPVVDLEGFRGDPVTVLWMVPISRAEQRAAATGGSVFERLARGGRGWIHRRG